MTYPGNSALGDEVKQRVLTTFGQSIELAGRGRRQEAMLGCDFILELDPQFAPAKTLKGRLAAGDEIDPATLNDQGEDPSADDLFDYEAPTIGSAFSLGAADEEEGAGGGLADQLAALLDEREFAQVLTLASEEQAAVAREPELGVIVETAQARLEAQPYVESFLKEAGTAIRVGDLESSGAALDKARSLDPDHPLLAELTRSWDAALARIESSPPPRTVASATPPPSAAPAAPPAGAREAPAPPRAPAGQLGEPALDMGDETLLSPPPRPVAGRAKDASEARIEELLSEGQAAAARDDLQGAIDAWSRIFLIDVDHTEAARRIEDARRRKAEIEREVEEVFHEGLDALDQGDRAAARVRFERVLEMHPNHLVAREYLQQLDSGGEVEVSGPGVDDTAAVSGLGSLSLGGAGAAGRPAGGAPLREEILIPVAPGEVPAPRPAPPARAAMVPAARPARRSFVLIGGAVLILVLLAAWLVLENRERWFPNSTAPEEEPAAATASPGLIERAIRLHESGQTAMAVGQLRRLPPSHPQYAQAQELIALWEAATAPEDEVVEKVVSPQELELRSRLIASAETAFANRELLQARELLGRAAAIAPLGAGEAERRQVVEQQLAPIAQEIELFEQGEYDFLLPRLWRLFEADRGDRNVRRLLVDSYFNRGVRELQRGDPVTASREFREALALAPQDDELQRLSRFAQTYEARPRDLLYRIFVKYLSFRG